MYIFVGKSAKHHIYVLLKVIDTETPIKVAFSVRYHLVYVFMNMSPNKQEYLKYKLKKEYKTKENVKGIK